MSESLYQEIILDHYKNPHGRGLREPYNGESHQVNPTCGDELTVRIALADDKITDVSYDGQGCSISQASASVLHEQLVGLPLAEALPVMDEFTALLTSKGEREPNEDVLGDGIAFAGVAKYPARVKCGLLAWMGLKAALANASGEKRGE
ncbi:MAG: SUF system NifU family Fe-S cluster assembly protein [Corynebacteriales bacterium]|nr:SUF system NifU family Fe-S cluster assembly protein [Mycobacteriales bacterium]